MDILISAPPLPDLENSEVLFGNSPKKLDCLRVSFLNLGISYCPGTTKRRNYLTFQDVFFSARRRGPSGENEKARVQENPRTESNNFRQSTLPAVSKRTDFGGLSRAQIRCRRGPEIRQRPSHQAEINSRATPKKC